MARFREFLSLTRDCILLWFDIAVRSLFNKEPTLPLDQSKNILLPTEDDTNSAAVEQEVVVALFAADPEHEMFNDDLLMPVTDLEELDDGDYESDRIIMVTMPWGQIIPIPFSGDQWKMIKEISEESGETMIDVLEDIIAKRYEMAQLFVQDLHDPDNDVE